MSLHPSTRQLLKLTTHPAQFDVDPEPIEWAHPHPMKRGPVVATVSHPGKRNAIGAHSGTYSVYRAVALACRCEMRHFHHTPPVALGSAFDMLARRGSRMRRQPKAVHNFELSRARS
eukprot:2050507-Pleurochrysis_carterae.AAC.1